MKSFKKRVIKLRKSLSQFFKRAKKTFAARKKTVLAYVDKKPYKSFFIVLGTLLLLIILSNILGSPRPQEKPPVALTKQVNVYSVGAVPRLNVAAQIEKSGVLRINALTPGVVSAINKKVGQSFRKGETLLRLSTNYQGGNSASLSRLLAQRQYQNVADTYDLNKDIIKKQREIAEKADTQADELRAISEKSISETQSLINLNNEILAGLDRNLSNLEATNVGGANDALILSTKQLKAQFLAANNSANGALRMTQFNTASDKPPAELSNLQKEVTLQQLALQERMLDLNREVSKIQLQIAQVTEAMMFPAAPVSGTVQRISVKAGQQVNPGQELMIISETAKADPVVAIVYVSRDLSKRVSKLEPSVLHINDTATIEAFPFYVTQDAIQGQLYGVYFNIPKQYVADVTERGFISVELPIGYFDTGSSVPYIPIDAIYQTKDQDYVFVAEGGKAVAKLLDLGEVFGNFVEIKKGLGSGDMVILNRNVIAGDPIAAQ